MRYTLDPGSIPGISTTLRPASLRSAGLRVASHLLPPRSVPREAPSFCEERSGAIMSRYALRIHSSNAERPILRRLHNEHG